MSIDPTTPAGSREGLPASPPSLPSAPIQASPQPVAPSASGPGLVISWNDLSTPDVEARVQQMKEAQSVPLVRNVGTPVDEVPTRWWWNHVVQMSIAGLAGGLLAWAIIEMFLRPDAETGSNDNSQLPNILFGAILTASIGLLISLWEPLTSRDWRKAGRVALIAVPVNVGLGVIAGLIAGTLYRNMVSDVVERLVVKWTGLVANGSVSSDTALKGFSDELLSQLHLPRAVAWTIVGLAAGLGVGIVSRSGRRLVNTSIGGLVGGFLGGFLFDYMNTGWVARAVGMSVLGLLIGLATGLIEQVRKSMWLVIRSGGMAGKQFILYRDSVVIGSAPDCDITLVKDPAIAAHHLRITRSGSRVEVLALDAGFPLLVDGQPVPSAVIHDGSSLQAGSTLLGFHEQGGSAVPTTGPVQGP